jgi:hypothetical protein
MEEVNERASILYAGIILAIIVILVWVYMAVPIQDRAYPELFAWLADPEAHGGINTDQWSVVKLKL